MVYDGKAYRFVSVTWVDHPFVLPQFSNGFSYTTSFLAETVTRFFAHMLSLAPPDDDKDEVEESLNRKILAVKKVSVILKEDRMKREKQLLNPTATTKNNVEAFTHARHIDNQNEKRPLDFTQVRRVGAKSKLQRITSCKF